MEAIRHTIKEWESITGVEILDPDGFNRKDANLSNSLFTLEEFYSRSANSTINLKVRVLTFNEISKNNTIIRREAFNEKL